MFGGHAFGEAAFGEQDHVAADSSAFQAFLAEVTAERCWLLELDALSLASSGGGSSAFGDSAFGEFAFGEDFPGVTGGATTLYFSTHGYTDVDWGDFARAVEQSAQAGSANTLTLASTETSIDEAFSGRRLLLSAGAGATQERPILHYDGATKVATCAAAWRANALAASSAIDNAAWTKQNLITITADYGIAPDGTSKADRVQTTGAHLCRYFQTVTGFSGKTVCFALKMRSLTGVNQNVQVWLRETGFGTTYIVSTVTVTPAWQTFSASAAIPGGSAGVMAMIYDSSASKVWDFLACDHQFNEGSTPGEFIETGDAAITLPDGTTQYKIGSAVTGAWYDGRIQGEVLVERAIVGREGVGGLARTYAEITLINRDGGLDTLLRDYALDGRAAKILIGRPTDARADFGTLFAGVFDRASIDLATLKIRLSDGLAKLDAPVQPTKYAGTGGLEGGADLAGKPKPRGYGKVFNISPPPVDAVNLIYQVHDGAIQDVTAVRDRGIELTKVSGAPAAGEYQVDTAAGTFKLGATPAGTVTCDAELDVNASGYAEKTGDILLRLLATTLNSSEIDPTSFATLNDAAPAPVGIRTGTEEIPLAEAADELLAGIGAFGGFTRVGRFGVARLAAAAGATPAASYDESDITAIEREPLPAPLDPAVWRTLVGYQKNYTVQNDFAAAVPAAVRTFAAEPMRIAKKESATVHSQRLLSREYGPTASLYRDQADADAEAQRLLDLWSADRAPYRIRLRPRALIHELGDVIEVKHPRLGLANGAPMRIIGYRVAGTRVELRVLP